MLSCKRIITKQSHIIMNNCEVSKLAKFIKLSTGFVTIQPPDIRAF